MLFWWVVTYVASPSLMCLVVILLSNIPHTCTQSYTWEHFSSLIMLMVDFKYAEIFYSWGYIAVSVSCMSGFSNYFLLSSVLIRPTLHIIAWVLWQMECKYKSALSSNKAYCGIISYSRGSRSENGILQHNCHTSYIVVAKSLGIQRKYQPISTLMKMGAVKIL